MAARTFLHHLLTVLVSTICVVLVALVIFLSPPFKTDLGILKIEMPLLNVTEYLDVGDSPEYMKENYFFNRTGYPDYFDIGLMGECKIAPNGSATCGDSSFGYKWNFFQMLVDGYHGDMISQDKLSNLTVQTIQNHFGIAYAVNPLFNKIFIAKNAILAGFILGIICALCFWISAFVNIFMSRFCVKKMLVALYFHLAGVIFAITGAITTGVGLTLKTNVNKFIKELNSRSLSYRLYSTVPKLDIFSMVTASFALYIYLLFITLITPMLGYRHAKRSARRQSKANKVVDAPADQPPAYRENIHQEEQFLDRTAPDDMEKKKDNDSTPVLVSPTDSYPLAEGEKNQNRTYDSRYPKVFYPWFWLFGIPTLEESQG